MKKQNFVFLFLAVLGLFLSAIMGKSLPTRPVVTSIELITRQEGVLYHHVLTDDKQMRVILGYLRATNTPFPAEELPADSAFPFHVIRVNLSDGSSHLYEQMADTYFRKDGSVWKIINPDQGSKLTKLEKFVFSNAL